MASSEPSKSTNRRRISPRTDPPSASTHSNGSGSNRTEKNSSGPSGPRKGVAFYDYRGLNGERWLQKVRTEPKGFYWRYRTKDGRSWNRSRGQLPSEPQLYRVTELREAIDAGVSPVYVADGEKDVETLRAAGLVATCAPHGSEKWRDEYAAYFRGAEEVVVVHDDDSGHPDPHHRWHGYDGAVRTRDSIAARIGQDRVALLAPRKGCKDITDHFDAGYGISDLEVARKPATPRPTKAAKDARPYDKSFNIKATLVTDDDDPVLDDDDDPVLDDEEVVIEVTVSDFPLTDIGNAERLVDRHGEDLHYCHPWHTWLVWDGKRWTEDKTGEVDRRAKETTRAVKLLAADLDDHELAKKLFKHGHMTESSARQKAMIERAQSEPGIPVLPEQLDLDPRVANVSGGTLELAKGECREHRRSDLLMKMAHVDFEPEAKCPRWDAFLAQILPDPDTRAFLQRAVGYSLTGLTVEQVLFLLYGKGANGKTTFLETIGALLGDYAVTASPDLLLAKRPGGIPSDVARLQGARFITVIETEDGGRLAETLVKQLTGQDTITARRMYQDFFSFKMQGKLWLATNHLPQVRGTDEAIWRRILRIPFRVTIPKSKRDEHLFDKLWLERSGILNWAVEGCLAWQRMGLAPSEEVVKGTEEYRAESDVFGRFLSESCSLGKGYWTSSESLYQAYEAWAVSEKLQVMTKIAFSRKLSERQEGLVAEKRDDVRGWRGVTVGKPKLRVARSGGDGT